MYFYPFQNDPKKAILDLDKEWMLNESQKIPVSEQRIKRNGELHGKAPLLFFPYPTHSHKSEQNVHQMSYVPLEFDS